MGKNNQYQLTESEISMLLDAFMYLNYYESEEGQTLREILIDLEGHADYGGGGIHYGEYSILEQAVREHETLGNLKISEQSAQLGFDSGTSACLFSEEPGNTYYVVYRGTGDGEWLDNGLGMTEASTQQQKQALRYFDQVVKNKNLSDADNVIITGHSKGGNKAQYVTMETKNHSKIDRCYSIDGQGFSEVAIDSWKDNYGEKEYANRVQKIHGVQGENDYVNVLGFSIIPTENNRYIKTPVKKDNVAGFHDIKYMYAKMQEDGTTIFTGKRNNFVTRRGELAELAEKLSNNIMALEVDERAGCASVLMQLLELGGNKKIGVNGERATFSDLLDFMRYGVSTIISTVLFTESGRKLLHSIFDKNIGSTAVFEVRTLQLIGEGENLKQVQKKVKETVEEIETILNQLEDSMKQSIIIRKKLQKEISNIRKQEEKIGVLSKKIIQVANLYISCEQNVVSI